MDLSIKAILFRGLYNLALGAATLVAGPYYGLVLLLRGKYRRSLGPKLGWNGHPRMETGAGKPRIWLHAVSVGEVTAAAPIVSALRRDLPEAALIVSTSTETGQDMAQRVVTDASEIIYYPLDLPWVVGRPLDPVRPDVFVLVEKELWPIFIDACGRRGIRVVMANGRISPRSYRRYVRTRFFWRETLCRIDRLAMISTVDAERVTAMGAPSERVQVLGNAKYDGLAARVGDDLARRTGEQLALAAADLVWVAGSTHEGEEVTVLEVYGRLLAEYPRMTLILVPRHIDRAGPVRELVRQRGFSDVVSFSEILSGRPRGEDRVVVVDVIGELFKLYSLATVVFCGGSLVPRGGQNILEAAAWGKMVFYGPSMEDFSDERALLEGIGVGVTVRDGKELFQGIREALRDPEARRRREQAARSAVAANRGAAARHAAVIREVLEPP
jgi:3-deoxy-D-manno-octulosonic-acid transferase